MYSGGSEPGVGKTVSCLDPISCVDHIVTRKCEAIQGVSQVSPKETITMSIVLWKPFHLYANLC